MVTKAQLWSGQQARWLTSDASDADLDGAGFGPDVLVVGLGYVGLTLAVGLACAGVHVLGYEIDGSRIDRLSEGVVTFCEPGLAEALGALPSKQLRFDAELPDQLPPATIICVGTPIDPGSLEPRLEALEAAATAIGQRAREGDLIIVRSTVPVGTTRRVVLPKLSHLRHPLLAFSPERTIQGRALQELRELPQLIGGIDEASSDATCALFAALCDKQVRLSSLEAAELVKLVNNAHTDTLYAFGNEVALMAEQLGLDAMEVRRAANVDYPRPDIAGPGFVGGGCLTKDPYLLMASMPSAGYVPQMVPAARRLNESLPRHVVERFCAAVKEADGDRGPTRSTVVVCGLAYKGNPPTDDLRGSAAPLVLEFLRGEGLDVVAHDHLVTASTAATLGVPLMSLDDAFVGARGAIFLTDHPGYRELDIGRVVSTMDRPAVILDCWGVVVDRLGDQVPGVRCLRLGRG